MPGTYTYPGVYVEEVPSGVRTISGVSTSNTAFVDVFARGEVDKAIRITSFADFQREFGGLDRQSEASYAIQQYYLNGGQIAWVVRVAAGNPTTATLTLPGGSPLGDALTVSAANPGAWGSNLAVAVVTLPSDPTRPTDPPRFNLVAREAVNVNNRLQVLNTETHRNLSMSRGDKQYVENVVNTASSLIRVKNAGIGAPPIGQPATGSGEPDASSFQTLAPGRDGDVVDPLGNLVDDVALSKALLGDPDAKTGMYALDRIAPEIFNILCLPVVAKMAPGTMQKVYGEAEKYCGDPPPSSGGHRAFLIIDIPAAVDTQAKMTVWMKDNDQLRSRNAAVYFPRLEISDRLNDDRSRNVGASGTMAGLYARIDATRGVWKAPAGTDATIRGASLATLLTDLENGALNPIGINVLRRFPIFGPVAWGARSLEGADQQASEWKYIPIRRTALFIEESLYEGLKWVVFEPNDEPLWSQIRLNVGAFMQDLFRQGAFQGKTPNEAYFVKCDKETTTQNDIDRGIVNILVGFAPLKPAEFVVIKIQQIAGQIQT